MAGDINSPSVIWVAGEPTGRSGGSGAAGAAIPGDLLATVSGVTGLATEAYVNARSAETRGYADNVTSSGVTGLATEVYADASASAAANALYDLLVASGVL
jgi:hypothetical protein